MVRLFQFHGNCWDEWEAWEVRNEEAGTRPGASATRDNPNPRQNKAGWGPQL